MAGQLTTTFYRRAAFAVLSRCGDRTRCFLDARRWAGCDREVPLSAGKEDVRAESVQPQPACGQGIQDRPPCRCVTFTCRKLRGRHQ